MRVLGYKNAHQISQFQICELDVPMPTLRPHDVLVRIKAFALNPIDYKIRQSRSCAKGQPVILGWDAAGVIDKVGTQVDGFKLEDEVFYAGDLTRDGSYAEFQAVDSRIIAKKPKTLSFEKAAALPLTSLTAWESLFERGMNYTEESKVLVIGGAGGVGSIATQLLKAKTKAKVISTASRKESEKWCKSMGADLVLDHSKDLLSQLVNAQCGNLDFVLGTTHSDRYLEVIPKMLRPFGHFCHIDDPLFSNVSDFKRKSLSVHWELMFTKTLFQHDLESQGNILTNTAALVDQGLITPTASEILHGMKAEHIRYGHELLESGKSIGKIVVRVTE